MFPLPKYVMYTVSVGHALLFSMSLVGGVRIVSSLLGTPVEPSTANSIFGISALITMPLAAYLNIARLLLPANQRETA